MSLLPFLTVESISTVFRVDEIYDFISSGASASVYRAEKINHPTYHLRVPDNVPVALKVIEKKNIVTEREVRDVINEVAILKCVRHRNIVQLYDVFQTSREVVLVMEYVDGQELLQSVTSSRGLVLPEARTKAIILQIVEALEFLHVERHVVHRDLKPENILLTKGDQVTVVDFGLAKFFGHRRVVRRGLATANVTPLSAFALRTPSDEPLRRSTSMASSASVESMDSMSSHTNSPILATPCGTLRYAAPETVRTLADQRAQFETTRGSMPKLDMYPVGIITFIVLSGHLPFDTKNKNTLASQMEQGAKFVGPKWDTVSEEAKDFVRRLMVTEPTKRMTAADALNHPWLCVKPTTSVSEDSCSTVCGETSSEEVVRGSTSVAEDAHYDATIGDRKRVSVAFSAMLPGTSNSTNVVTSLVDSPPPVNPQTHSSSYFF